MAASLATGVSLNHISRESSDIRRLANFYKEVSQDNIFDPKKKKKNQPLFQLPNFFFFGF